MSTSKSNFWSSPLTKSRITSDDVKMPEMLLGYFIGPFGALLSSGIFTSILQNYFTDVLKLDLGFLTENAIEWLCLSGIVSQVYKVEQIKKPLENYRDIDAFKIYVSDLGLLCAKKDLAANDILYMVDEINDFKGGMAENYVNVQLSINGYHTYYWESERGAEIDFIIQRDGQLIPIEVKSADNTRAKSLKVYMDTYKPAYAIKLSAKNFGFEDNKKIVPLYAAFCI